MSDQQAASDNPLVARYAGREAVECWGPLRRARVWRQLWLALAEAQHELGLLAADGSPRVRESQLRALRDHLDDVDLGNAARHERRLRHDVMAHVHALGDVCPEARDVVHLGATSCDITDNGDLVLIRESLRRVRDQLAGVIDALARFALRWRGEPCLGYTHYQPAQLTTVGKRACLWCYDLVLDYHEVGRRLDGLRFRGIKGTTGTQASFLALFGGDHDKVRRLEEIVARKMGFELSHPVTGQTYPRKVDSQVLDTLGGVAQSAAKWGNDLRLLAHDQEVDEPFEEEQVGSSAMAYKRNPMRAERMCSLARFLSGLVPIAAQTASAQWLERTLDDSAARRLYLPQAFLCADGLLRVAGNLAGGLVVNREVVARHVGEYLPYMATENLLMASVARGHDRQEVHEVIRRHSMAVTRAVKDGTGGGRDLFDRLRAEPAFAGVDVDAAADAARYVGRAPEQVEEFVAEFVESVRRAHPGAAAAAVELHV